MQIAFISADVSMIGRFDASMVPEQQILDLFFTPNDPKTARRYLGGDADDGCTWNGVHCSTAGEIKEIQLSWDFELSGSIDFRRMPTHLELIHFCEIATFFDQVCCKFFLLLQQLKKIYFFHDY